MVIRNGCAGGILKEVLDYLHKTNCNLFNARTSGCNHLQLTQQYLDSPNNANVHNAFKIRTASVQDFVKIQLVQMIKT